MTATVTSGAGGTGSALTFVSAEYGTDSFVSVKKLPGTTGGDFWATYDQLGATATAIQRDSGEDVLALVNGSVALGKGTTVRLNSSALNVELKLTEDFATTLTSKSFEITGGGALFQIGPKVSTTQQISFGIQSVAASHLGDSNTGFLSSIVSGGDNSLVNRQTRQASEIIEKAITQIAVMRGRLGAFERNTLQTNVRSLQIALENVTASESQIRDADFAAETAELTRAQLLNQVGTTVLATANNNAANVLSLLQ